MPQYSIYTYYCGEDIVLAGAEETTYDPPIPGTELWPIEEEPFAETDEYRCYAIANLDTDDDWDIWVIDDETPSAQNINDDLDGKGVVGGIFEDESDEKDEFEYDDVYDYVDGDDDEFFNDFE